MKYHVVHDLTEHQALQLHALFQNEWWTKGRSPGDIAKMLQHTDIIFGLVEDATGRLLGFARVLTDWVYKALVLDVMVHPDCRGLGLGRKLMDEICSHPELEQVGHVDLHCLPEMVAFYEAWGFTTELGELKFMRRERIAGGTRLSYKEAAKGRGVDS